MSPDEESRVNGLAVWSRFGNLHSFMAKCPETCPNCGVDVPRNSKACPECGADETTGWSDNAYAGSLGLPDEDFDYNDFVKREFENEKPSTIKPAGLRWLWWAVGVLVIAGLFLGWIL